MNDELTIVTASADSTLRISKWKASDEGDTIASFQIISLFNGICFAVNLYELPNAGIILAYSDDKDEIQLYSGNNNMCFEKFETLSGHEDWVRGLDFTTDDNGDTLLASSSQDSFIRLWRISSRNDEIEGKLIDDEIIHIEERTFKVANRKFAVSLESVLQGHENWVYSVHFGRNSDTGVLQLLSCSMDKTIIIWTIDKDLAMWTEKIRVGEVGGNGLGFYGAKFHSNGKKIAGHGFQGSLHLWQQSKDNDRLWHSGIINGGHYKEVMDLAWEPSGAFLFSVSTDQTTRIHAEWKQHSTYHEIARPQVHGYDMQCIAVLSRYKFASASEEKIVRTFQAPGNFVENFRSLVGVEKDPEGDELLGSNPKGASVPSLGLSNKAVYEEDIENAPIGEKKFKDEYPENYFVPIHMTEPPTEEYLMQNTLWPEMQKLYAHGYELYSLAATKDGSLLASACKATTQQHAEIILWNTSTWKIEQRLQSHKLTVTQMKFSSDGKRLLSVSRDRRWSMFENKPSADEKVKFELVASTDRNNGIHQRLIWTCGWSHDDDYFATGSRDGKIALWRKFETVQESSLNEYQAMYFYDLPKDSITALAFANRQTEDGKYLLAVGLESGFLHIYTFNKASLQLQTILNQSEAHHLCINKLEFKPNTEKFILASCGNDNIVKIYNIEL